MPLLTLEHFLVLTEDIEATRDFYCDVLEMQQGFRPPLPFPGFWLYLQDVPCIHIAEWESYTAHSNSIDIPVSKKQAGTGPVDHIAFNALDFPGFTSQLDKFNAIYKVNSVASGLRQVFLNDPNGVKIELNFAPGQ